MQKIFIIVACLFLLSCNSIQSIKQAITKAPYDQYIRSLEQAKLDDSLMGKAWVEAGEQALHDSVVIDLPFSESGYFKASEPAARSYQFNVKDGQVLTVNGAVIAKENIKLFLDLFVWKDNAWEPLSHADSTFNLTYEFNKDFSCLLRIQPELLATVYYTITIGNTPALINPVAGATNKSIGSFYGADRDGGKRSHEGIDIFAKRGTPVVAPTAGYVSRVGNNNLGGKVVWLQDKKRGHAYYFAHLDSQWVKPGVMVKQGDTLGTVGNTGNARYTPAHLHFGIYQSGSKDPVHYVRTLEATVNALPWDTAFQHQDFKVVNKLVNLRSGPGEKHQGIDALTKDSYVKVVAQSKSWYRIILPNKKQGYIYKSTIAPIENGKRLKLDSANVLLSETNIAAAPLAYLESSTAVQVLAHFENFRYVKTKTGLLGWLLL